MMAGSCVTDPTYFAEITGRLLDIIGHVHQELGIEFEFIDLGGGLGIPYRPEESPLDLDRAIEGIVTTFTEKIHEHGLTPPRLVMEPGRYFVANAGYLLAKIHAKKEGYETIYGCDAGMNIVPRVILYGAYHAIRVNSKEHLPHSPTNLTGQICEQTDLWGKNLLLPPLEIGDLLVMENMGAYCYAMSYPYNGRLRPAEVLVANGNAELIRHAETLEDTLRRTTIPKHLAGSMTLE
jgi:diaminopimelate decarboxylase